LRDSLTKTDPGEKLAEGSFSLSEAVQRNKDPLFWRGSLWRRRRRSLN